MQFHDVITKATDDVQRWLNANMPGFQAVVDIHISPVYKVKVTANEPESVTANEPAVPITLESLRLILNGYAKTAGKTKALTLVRQYTPDKTAKPEDVPEDKRSSLVGAIREEVPALSVAPATGDQL